MGRGVISLSLGSLLCVYYTQGRNPCRENQEEEKGFAEKIPIDFFPRFAIIRFRSETRAPIRSSEEMIALKLGNPISWLKRNGALFLYSPGQLPG